MKKQENFVHQYFGKLKAAINAIERESIEKVVKIIFKAYERNKQIFILGNGGSASTASHFACDLGKGTLANVYHKNERRFRVISLTDNVATMTAFGNDLAFEDIFHQQLRNLVENGDIVIGISASGNSPNILKALTYAKSCKATTIGLLGFKTGGKAKKLVDYDITIQDTHYGRVEDIHLALCHLITDNLTLLRKNSNKELYAYIGNRKPRIHRNRSRKNSR